MPAAVFQKVDPKAPQALFGRLLYRLSSEGKYRHTQKRGSRHIVSPFSVSRLQQNLHVIPQCRRHSTLPVPTVTIPEGIENTLFFLMEHPDHLPAPLFYLLRFSQQQLWIGNLGIKKLSDMR
ncbi:MAG: hypothetical protein A4E62_01759 [Syntrophorhabdus sp. PtaU1.Bin002]|nr:MAG: hypothetical protein A4E62_01759 [Syntrophorhabdus sp. PtaU1.Bin002]